MAPFLCNYIDMIRVTENIIIDESELLETFSRASGPGGQHVNKVETSVTLKFNVLSSPSLNEGVRSRLKILAGQKWTKDGFLVIHVDKHRSQARNRDLARLRLLELVKKALILPKTRIGTRPTRIANKKRLDEKTKRGQIKVLRKYIRED
mgnify:FL=1